MAQYDHFEIRLVKYSKLIDQAIATKRYSLATNLAYRCLLEYQRLAARFLIPHVKSPSKNAFQLSTEMVQHLRKSSGSLTWTKTRQLFALLSTSYHLTTWSKLPFGDRDLQVDLAMATYARDQSLQLSRFLIGTVQELRSESESGSANQ